MSRGDLNEEQWERLKLHLPNEQTGQPDGQWKDHRLLINGILWGLRTSTPWRDLPERYGPWQTCYDRLPRWQRDGPWRRLLQTLQQAADERSDVAREGCAVDSTSIKAHPQAAGAPRQKGGLTASQKKRPRSPRKRWDAAEAV